VRPGRPQPPAEGKTLMTFTIRKYINPKFDCFYKLKTVEIKEIYHQLLESEYWEKEIKYKTWKVRLKALEYYISYRENQ